MSRRINSLPLSHVEIRLPTFLRFEPIGGSAPKYTGKGVVSPFAAIAACQMMLEHLGEGKAAKGIEEALMKAVARDVKSLSAGKMGYSTSQVGDLVIKYLLGK